MQQWQYRVEWYSSVSFMDEALNGFGRYGWELVGIYEDNSKFYAVFKRPKED